ncbi:MAG: YebC/PmpR family DNA-binding transcriptional regulator [Deltaproteobacteria bacterium]|nr:YebC/PmpR family DNA-binding transcriptional regulator [Deltaproteobacteria bacterium]
MSGHSKWSTIKHKKGAADAKRGKIFTKLIKELTVAARVGGGDPDGNPRLRAAIAGAKGQNMPKDNIERAIKKGTGELEGVNYEEVTLEGYGPSGVAVLVESLTDNRNRTVAEVRHTFAKYGRSLGEAGSVAWIFHQKGLIAVNQDAADEDKLMEVALEAGAEDVRREDQQFEVVTAPEELETVKESIEKAGIPVETAEITMLPQTTISLDRDHAVKMLKLMDVLEDNDDVQNVYANFDISDEIMESIE